MQLNINSVLIKICIQEIRSFLMGRELGSG